MGHVTELFEAYAANADKAEPPEFLGVEVDSLPRSEAGSVQYKVTRRYRFDRSKIVDVMSVFVRRSPDVVDVINPDTLRVERTHSLDVGEFSPAWIMSLYRSE